TVAAGCRCAPGYQRHERRFTPRLGQLVRASAGHYQTALLRTVSCLTTAVERAAALPVLRDAKQCRADTGLIFNLRSPEDGFSNSLATSALVIDPLESPK